MKLTNILPTLPRSGVLLYSRNLLWSLFFKISSLIISLGTMSIMTRLLGPESFGIINYVISFGTIIAVFVGLGIDNLVYKKLTEDPEHRDEILSTAIVLKIVAGSIAFLALSAASFFSGETSLIKLLIVLFGITYLTQPLSLLYFDFLKERDTKTVGLIQISTLFIASSLKISALYYTESIALFILIQSLETLISGLLSLYVLKRLGRPLRLIPSKKRALTFISFLAPLTLFSVFSEIYSKIDMVMLKNLQNVTAVGLYAGAVRLTEVWYFVSFIISTTFFPALANAFNQGNSKEYLKRIGGLGLGLIGTGLLIGVATLLLSKPLVLTLYGEQFHGSIPLLNMYIFSLVGTLILGVLYQDLLLRNRIWEIVVIAAIPALVNILLNLYLIPNHGGIGAALATVISYNCITVYFLFHLFNEKRKLKKVVV